jgi:hypothetical protein
MIRTYTCKGWLFLYQQHKVVLRRRALVRIAAGSKGIDDDAIAMFLAKCTEMLVLLLPSVKVSIVTSCSNGWSALAATATSDVGASVVTSIVESSSSSSSFCCDSFQVARCTLDGYKSLTNTKIFLSLSRVCSEHFRG